jgi:ATP-dependent Lon protease
MVKELKSITQRSSKMSKVQEQKSHQKRRGNHSDSDDDDELSYSSDDDEVEEEELDPHEYRKFLSKLFPSKNMSEKIKSGEKLKKLLKNLPKNEDESEEEEEEDESVLIKKKSKSKVTKKKHNKKVIESESEDDDEVDDVEIDNKKNSSNKFNIIFTIGQNAEDDEEWYDEDDSDYDDEDEETEDEDVSVSSDDDDTESDEDDDVKPKRKSPRLNNKKNETNTSNTNDEELLKELKALYEKNKSNKMAKECFEFCSEKLKENEKKKEKKEEKQKQKNGRIFKRIIRDKNTMNDFAFFEKLSKEEQVKIIKEVREINKITRVEKPYRITLLESTIPPQFKAIAMKKINSLRYMEPGSGEHYKVKNWTDAFMSVPFGIYKTLPVNISQGVDICHEFMGNAQQTLDSAVYGLNDAKMQIMQMLGQLVTNPTAIGTSIAIKGPPGTGKTTLVKEGISKILNRPFAFIALGGATDSSFLEGHSYTYEGSTWGKIVQIIIDSKCMNPVIYFDELDKISDTPKGEEIAGILTHLTDTSQNSQFHDKYFAEIDFDLSKCLFIFSYNDESKVNPILKDRMYRIQTKGYDKKQKTNISKDYLLPKIREQVKFSEEDVVITDEALHHIIDTHCDKEDGVRNLKRCLEIIYTKLNLYRLMKPGSNLFEEEMALTVEFPFTVTKEVVDKLIKREKETNMSLSSMYI